jgi:endonuclease YncB( thermonuclease family)
MNSLYYLLLTLATLAPAASSTSPPLTDTFTGTVITPQGEKRVIIRLAGIDAPELKQPFGIASRDKLRSMILNRRAKAKCHKIDRYKRQVCVVYFNGDDINLQMVRAGMAWHYKRYQNEQSRRNRWRYALTEKIARIEETGLWSGESVEPWVYRKMN